MKRLILTLAAALTLGGIAAAPAAAQPRDRTVVRTTTVRPDGPRDRTVVRTTHTTVMRRHTDYSNRGWHRGWDRGRHHGWRNHRRVCRTTWRHHQRIRTCRSW
jgi:Ni/Co efflux regulator RcnB